MDEPAGPSAARAPGVAGPPVVVRLGRGVTDDLAAATRREWLLTNGRGGYAMGTLAGHPTRRYHGWLVAAIDPPVGRTVLVGGLETWVVVDGRRIGLHALAGRSGPPKPPAWTHLARFELHGTVARWRYELADVSLIREAWMAHGRDTTYVRLSLDGAPRTVTIDLRPLVTWRDHHAAPDAATLGDPAVTVVHAGETWPTGLRVAPGAGPIIRVLADAGRAEPDPRWIHEVRLPEETARGEADRTALLRAGSIRAELRTGGSLTLALTAEPETLSPDPGAEALAAELGRAGDLLARAAVEPDADPLVAALVLAADAFVVDRSIPARDPGDDPIAGRTVIAGYPWFNDWGRDTMIALPGLCLATGRAAEAATILRSFARFESSGLIPNDFPDAAGDVPMYNTADASLWFVTTLGTVVRATADPVLLADLLPTARAIVDAHLQGTRFGIGVDPVDGLLRAAAPGYQLTWMDAKVEGWVVTPREGKPVELQALWHEALCTVAEALRSSEPRAAARYDREAERARVSFRERFWDVRRGYLLDVVDGPTGDDPALRPNQLLALSLPHPLVTGAVAEAVLDRCGATLATSLGLRSLAPDEPGYLGRHRGDRRSRDAAYHQGTVWSWLIGPYLDAVLAVRGDAAAVRAALEPFRDHLADAGLGSVSETFDGDAPHRPTGCIAQAWGVAEVLRLARRVA